MGLQCRFLALHFEFVLAFSSEVKGWRRFMIADAWASFVRLGGRGADKREKGTGVMDHEPKDRGKRQADRSDVRQEFARKRPEPVSSPMDKRTGASPSCLKNISRPLPFDASFPFRSCEPNAAAFRRAP
jgi:hypothetical protein